MTEKGKLILVGVISAAHGIKGHVLVKSYTKPESNISHLPLVDKNHNDIKIKMIRVNSKNNVICSMPESKDRNKAEELKGTKLYCYREDLPIASEDEFYIEDLKNLKVHDESGDVIGEVLEIANYGAGDILEIKFNDGKSEMFAFTSENFPVIKKDHIIFTGKRL